MADLIRISNHIIELPMHLPVNETKTYYMQCNMHLISEIYYTKTIDVFPQQMHLIGLSDN